MAAFFQVNPQLAVVVNLAIENDGDAVIFVERRLLTSQQIDDRQAPHAQRDPIINQITFRIRTAMDHAVAH